MGGRHERRQHMGARTPEGGECRSPECVGALQVDIKIGDPLSRIFYKQQREQEELLLAQYTQGLSRRRSTT
jgi:hypothetical protein